MQKSSLNKVGKSVCGACNGSKVLDIKHCFCCAYEPSECGCDADWSDYVYWGDEQ